MNRLLLLTTATVLGLSASAQARDCTPVETSPGVKTKPAGCTDLGRELTPKKSADDRLRGSNGYIINRDGTRVRIGGTVGAEIGVRGR